jgi:hypothetical protein
MKKIKEEEPAAIVIALCFLAVFFLGVLVGRFG